MQIFISYSHQNKRFAESLRKALENAGYSVWIDKKDIQPTARWIEAIESGISESFALVAISSPDYVSSDICRHELSFAVEHHKKIVPIIYKTVSESNLPQEFRTLQWITRKNKLISKVFDEVINALNYDQTFTEKSTRILNQANYWLNGDRHTSYLLRGQNLRVADQLLKEGERLGKTPAELEPQRQFILASHRSNRLRKIRASALIALVIIITLRITLPLLVANQSLSDINSANHLASEAIAQIDNRPDIALLLSVEASKLADTSQTRDSLLKSLTRWPHLKAFLPTSTPQSSSPVLAFSPDSKTLATVVTSSDSLPSIDLWDIASRRIIGVLSDNATAGYSEIQAISFSPDGSYLAARYEIFKENQSIIDLWNTSNRRLAKTFHEIGGGNIAFDPVSATLATDGCIGIDNNYNCIQSKVDLWDMNTYQLLGSSINTDIRSIQFLKFRESGKEIVVGGCLIITLTGCLQNTIELYDITAHSLISKVTLSGTDYPEYTLSSDDNTIAFCDTSQSIVFLNLNTATTQKNQSVDGDCPIGYSQDDETFFVGSPGEIGVMDLSNHTFRKFSFPLTENSMIGSFVLSPDKMSVAFPLEMGIGIWSTDPNQGFAQHISLSDNDGQEIIGDINLGASGSEIVVVTCANVANTGPINYICNNGKIHIWELGNNPYEKSAFTINNGNNYFISQALISPDGKVLVSDSCLITTHANPTFSYCSSDRVQFWDLSGHEIGDPIDTSQPYDHLFFGANGEIVIWCAGDGIHLADTRTGRPVGLVSYPNSFTYVPLIQPSSDGNFLAIVGTNDNSLFTADIFDLATRKSKEFSVNVSSDASASSIAFSSDDSQIAIIDMNEKVNIYNVRTGSFDENAAFDYSIYGVAFINADTIAVASRYDVQLWGLNSQSPMGSPLPLEIYPVTSSIGSPDIYGGIADITLKNYNDNSLLIWSDEDDTNNFLLLDMRLSTLVSSACRIAGYNLTLSEWKQYLGNRPYHPVC